MARPRAVALVPLAALLSRPVFAAQRAAFSSRALAVRVDVLVTDGGKPVGGLTARDFELRDNGVVQTLEVVDGANVPINTVLALDTSVSTRRKRQAGPTAAGAGPVAGLKPGDRVALTPFSHAVTGRARLTSDFAAVRSELRSLEPAGQTAVMDGAYAAITATLGEPGRSLVLVCTDGYDTWSWLRPEDVVESARRSSVVMYAVTSSDARRETSLKSLADATGGHVLQVNSSRELRPAFERILQEFRNRYVLAYSPSGVAADGYQRLDIRVKRSGASVKAR